MNFLKLSDRVLDLKGRWFKTHRGHACAVSLNKTHYPLLSQETDGERLP